MSVLRDVNKPFTKTSYTKILNNYRKTVFFVRCMTNFKKLSNFEV